MKWYNCRIVFLPLISFKIDFFHMASGLAKFFRCLKLFLVSLNIYELIQGILFMYQAKFQIPNKIYSIPKKFFHFWIIFLFNKTKFESKEKFFKGKNIFSRFDLLLIRHYWVNWKILRNSLFLIKLYIKCNVCWKITKSTIIPFNLAARFSESWK